jgi:hypothetical protein
MAKKPPKPPKGPHPLTLKGERTETRAQEKQESPRFEKAERRLGIEGKYGKGSMKKGKKGGY